MSPAPGDVDELPGTEQEWLEHVRTDDHTRVGPSSHLMRVRRQRGPSPLSCRIQLAHEDKALLCPFGRLPSAATASANALRQCAAAHLLPSDRPGQPPRVVPGDLAPPRATWIESAILSWSMGMQTSLHQASTPFVPASGKKLKWSTI
eukprot:6189350-Pleurochrysis_carterae.AAC.4